MTEDAGAPERPTPTIDEALEQVWPRLFSPALLEAWSRSARRQARADWVKSWGAFWVSVAALAIAATSLALTLTR